MKCESFSGDTSLKIFSCQIGFLVVLSFVKPLRIWTMTNLIRCLGLGRMN